MGDGYAQYKYLFLGSSYAGFKIDFYAAGTSTGKDVWLDAAKNTAVQQVTSDSNGMAWWYGDGDYKLVVTDASGSTLYTWDNIKITSDTATMWEGNFGISYPTAAAANRWQMFAKVTAGNVFQELGINDGTAFRTLTRLDSNYNNIVNSIYSNKHPVYNVMHPDFGAVGDGVVDDYPAIQSAINAAQSAGGGVVFFPYTYTGYSLQSGELAVTTNNIALIGSPRGTIIQQDTDAKYCLKAGFQQTFITEFLMRDLKLRGRTGQVNCELNKVTLATVENCSFNSPSASNATKGLYLNDVANSFFSKLVIGSFNQIGLACRYVINTMLDSLLIEENTQSGIVIENTTPIDLSFFPTFINCYVDGNLNFGITASQRLTFIGGVVRGNTYGGIYLNINSDHSIIKGVEVLDNNLGGTAAAFDDDAIKLNNTSYCIIEGNTIWNEDTTNGKQDYGIKEEGTSDYNMIRDNTIRGMVTQSVSANGANTVVKDNVSDESNSIASASTLVLPSTGDWFVVTGTTDINSISNPGSAYRRKVTLRFTGVLTVFDNTGNLKIAGNLVTADNTILTLQYDSGIWYEISRSAN